MNRGRGREHWVTSHPFSRHRALHDLDRLHVQITLRAPQSVWSVGSRLSYKGFSVPSSPVSPKSDLTDSPDTIGFQPAHASSDAGATPMAAPSGLEGKLNAISVAALRGSEGAGQVFEHVRARSQAKTTCRRRHLFVYLSFESIELDIDAGLLWTATETFVAELEISSRLR